MNLYKILDLLDTSITHAIHARDKLSRLTQQPAEEHEEEQKKKDGR